MYMRYVYSTSAIPALASKLVLTSKLHPALASKDRAGHSGIVYQHSTAYSCDTGAHEGGDSTICVAVTIWPVTRKLLAHKGGTVCRHIREALQVLPVV